MPEKTEDRFKWEERFYEILADQRFVPSSPILMNADAENGGGLSSCFVISIQDSVAATIEQYVGDREYACDDESDAVAVGIAWLIQEGYLDTH